MQGLAAWIMRGRFTAIATTVVCAILPLLGWVSGAVVALVTLRRGAGEGLIVLLGSLVGVNLILALMAGQAVWLLGPALELWLPVLVLALWLRSSISLSSTLRLAAGLAALAVAAFYAAVGDPSRYWRPRFEQVLGSLPDGGGVWGAGVEQMLPMMTGFWALGLLIGAVASLLFGRWLQSLLYNPGGFAKEFRDVDLGRALAGAAAALWVGTAFGGPAILQDLALVISAVFVLQALSLVHALIAAKRLGGGWLIVTYLLLPFAFQLMAIAGMADAAFQWRQRLKLGAGS